MANHRGGTRIGLLSAVAAAPGTLPLAHQSRVGGPVSGDHQQVIAGHAPVTTPELGADLPTGPPVPERTVLVDALTHLHLQPAGVRRLEREPWFGCARFHARPLQRRQDARNFPRLGQAIEDSRGVAYRNDVVFDEAVLNVVGRQVRVNSVVALVRVVQPQCCVGECAQVTRLVFPARTFLVQAGRGVQPRQPLQRRVADRLVVDRGRPLVPLPHVRRIGSGLPLDVTPIGRVRALDQSRLRVAPRTEHQPHGPIQTLDHRLTA